MIFSCRCYFNCDSKNVIYLLMCKIWEWLYLGQINNLKQRVGKDNSDVFHPKNSFWKNCAEPLHCVNVAEWKNIFLELIYFYTRILKEKPSIVGWKPQMNCYQ